MERMSQSYGYMSRDHLCFVAQDFAHIRHLINYFWNEDMNWLGSIFEVQIFPWCLHSLGQVPWIYLVFVVSIVRLRFLKMLISRSICVKQFWTLPLEWRKTKATSENAELNGWQSMFILSRAIEMLAFSY